MYFASLFGTDKVDINTNMSLNFTYLDTEGREVIVNMAAAKAALSITQKHISMKFWFKIQPFWLKKIDLKTSSAKTSTSSSEPGCVKSTKAHSVPQGLMCCAIHQGVSAEEAWAPLLTHWRAVLCTALKHKGHPGDCLKIIGGGPASCDEKAVTWMTWWPSSSDEKVVAWMTWWPIPSDEKAVAWMTWLPILSDEKTVAWMTWWPILSDEKAGLILGLCPANKRCRYKIKLSLIGWAQT